MHSNQAASEAAATSLRLATEALQLALFLSVMREHRPDEAPLLVHAALAIDDLLASPSAALIASTVDASALVIDRLLDAGHIAQQLVAAPPAPGRAQQAAVFVEAVRRFTQACERLRRWLLAPAAAAAVKRRPAARTPGRTLVTANQPSLHAG